MKRLFALLVIPVLMLASCEPDPIHPVDVVDAPDFISVLDEDRNDFEWAGADEILVEGSGSGVYKVKGEGGIRCDLEKVSGDAGNGPFTAYYPADAKEHLNIPSEIAYSPEMPAEGPMVAISTNNILPFRSVLGTLVITLLSEQEIKVGKVAITANQPLSGDYQISGGKAVLSGNGGVNVDCGEGVAVNLTGTRIYLQLPAGRYDGLKMNIVDILGRERDLDLGLMPFTVEPAGIVGYPVDLGAVHQKRAILPSGPEFNKAIKAIANGTVIDSVTFQDRKIRSVTLDVNSAVDTGTMIQGKGSDYPIYCNYNKVSGAFTISTAASELYTVKDASSMFRCLTRVGAITNLKALNTGDSELMTAMFAQDGATALSLGELDLSGFNTSKVTRMDSMFFNMKQLSSLDLSTMDTRKCTTFAHFLDQAAKLKTVVLNGGFTACAARDLSYMFYGCAVLTDLDLSGFDTSGAEDMSYMFAESVKLTTVNLSGFNTSGVTDMNHMFYDCKKLEGLDLSSFETQRVENMASMFHNCNALKSLNVSSFATSNVYDMTSMFRNLYVLEDLDISNFNVTVINPTADYMFCQLRALKTLKLGDSFILNYNPGYFACSSLDASNTRIGSVPGKMTIICSQAIADWISSTTFRWINSGYSGAKAIPITFQDAETGATLNVVWASN